MTNSDLIEKLKKQFPIDMLSNAGIFEIKDIRLLDGTEKELKEGVVYFGHTEQLKCSNSCLSQLIICDNSNNLDEYIAYSNFSIIEEKSLFSAFNHCKDLLLEDMEIESNFSEIISMVLDNNNLIDITNKAAEKLNNSIVVFDLSYKILAYSNKKEINNVNWSQVVERGYCSYEFISAIQRLDDVKYSPADSTSFNVICSFDPMKKLCSKIIRNGNLVGYVMMFENMTAISTKHHKLLPLISLAVCETLMRDQNFSRLQGSLYENIIYDIIAGEDKEYVEKRILSLKLKFPDRMCVMVVSPSLVLGAKYIKGFLKDELKRIVLKSYSIHYDEHIIIVSPVNKNDLLSDEKLNSLREFARKESLQVGISYSFSNLTELNTYYIQALSALNLSQHVNSDKIIHTYEKNWFYHLINNIKKEKTSLDDYCHPALKKLYDYDLINNTKLFETLRIYLECDCVIKKTAEKLFIHRNSLSYRIERIYEICNISSLSVELKHALISSYMIYNYLEYVK